MKRPDPPKTTPEQRKNAMTVYIAILIAAAFLLMLLSYGIAKRNYAESLEKLTGSGTAAVGSVEAIQQENASLQQEKAALEQQNADLQSQIRDLQAQVAALERELGETDRGGGTAGAGASAESLGDAN